MTPGLTLRDTWPVALALVLFGGFSALLGFRWWPFADVTWHDAADLGNAFSILAALFSGLAFAGLIITILIQVRELRLQREQLAEQRKELAGQRAEMARLAEAQDEQNYALLISAFTQAEVHNARTSAGGPTAEFGEVYRFLARKVFSETAKRSEKRARELAGQTAKS